MNLEYKTRGMDEGKTRVKEQVRESGMGEKSGRKVWRLDKVEGR